MTQLKKTVEPFGEVNVYPSNMGATRVVATILMEPQREGAQTGIALDGSGSMRKLYGRETGGGVVSPILMPTSVRVGTKLGGLRPAIRLAWFRGRGG